MPIARFQMPDGRVARFEVPEGTTPEQAQQIGEQFAQSQPKGPSLVSPEASKMAAQGMGPLDTLAVSAGQGFDKLAMGLKQGVLSGVKRFGPESFSKAADQELKTLADQEAEKDSAYAGLRQARPILTGMGEAAPAIVATGGMGLLPSSATAGAVEALKYGTAEDRTKRGLLTAGANLVGGYAGQKLASAISPVANGAISATKRKALEVAESIGYKPRLSEVTGSQYAARLEDMAARTPGGAGVMDDFAKANQSAINARAAQGIGESANELTPEVFGNASSRIGKAFEDVKALPGKTIGVGPQVGAAADEILATQSKMIPAEQDAALAQLAKQAKVLAQNGGKIDGETYQLMRSGLSSQSWDAKGTNRVLYGKLLQALDDSAEQSLGAQGQGALAQALKEARPQYANLKTLEKGAVAEGGNVSPARLASALRTANPAAFRQGAMEGNPLYDVARIGESLKPLQAGSPTYERGVTSNLLDTAIKAGPAWLAAKVTTSPAMTWWPRTVAQNQLAAALAEPVSKLAEPNSKALANALAQRLLMGSVPLAAEND